MRPHCRRSQQDAVPTGQTLNIRREHRPASVPLILRTLVADGRLEAGAVSLATVRRLYVEHVLDRIPMREGGGQKTRLRWKAPGGRALTEPYLAPFGLEEAPFTPTVKVRPH